MKNKNNNNLENSSSDNKSAVSSDKRKGAVTALVAFSIAVTLLACALFTGLIISDKNNNRTKNTLNGMYTQALYEGADGLSTMENELSKLLVVSSGKYVDNTLYTLIRSSAITEDAITRLPWDFKTTENVSGLINQVGDWAVAVLALDDFNAATDKNVWSLYTAVKQVNDAYKNYLSSGDMSAISDLNFSIVDGEIDFDSIDYPEIIYDGPFSDSQKEKSFLGLENLETVSAEDAVRLIIKTTGAESARLIGEDTQPDGYEIEFTVKGSNGYALVSKKGGKLITLTIGGLYNGEQLSQDKSEAAAVKVAQDLGFGTLTPVWYNSGEGFSYVNLAPKVDGIIYYTDLVKVKLTGDTLCGFEAMGYCMNHTERLYSPMIDENAAKSAAENLYIQSVRLCVIPTKAQEKLCYELATEKNSIAYLIYVDAQTRDIVNVLRTVDSEQGTLVM